MSSLPYVELALKRSVPVAPCTVLEYVFGKKIFVIKRTRLQTAGGRARRGLSPRRALRVRVSAHVSTRRTGG